MKEALQDIWMAETRDDAYHAFSTFQKRFEAKYPKATNPIESMFATVRLRTNKTKSCGNRKTTLMMAYKLMRSAEIKWRRLRGFALIADVVKDVRFINGVKEMETHQQATACSPCTTFDNSSPSNQSLEKAPRGLNNINKS